MTSAYLLRPSRSYEQACREIDTGYLRDDPAIAELGKAIVAASEVCRHLVKAERWMEAGGPLGDQLRTLSDLVSDLRGFITILEGRR